MAETRRNDPCPCGSGKKYKACCRFQPDNPSGSEAVGLAWDWIRERYGDEVLHQAFDDYYLVSMRQVDRERLRKLPEPMMNMLYRNGREAVLAEGEIRTYDGMRPCLDVVLGPSGPELDADHRRYLEALRDQNMSLYECVQANPGVGFRVRDMLSEDESTHWLAEPLYSQSLLGAQGTIFGGRIIPGTPQRLCIAVFPSQKPHVFVLIDQIRKGAGDNPTPAEDRKYRSMFVIFGWLQTLLMGDHSLFAAEFSDQVN